MGGRAGGGARGGARSGMGSASRGNAGSNLMRIVDGKYGAITINKKKSPQQLLAQANRIEKALKGRVQSQLVGVNTLAGAVRVGRPQVERFRKVKAAQRLSKIVKGNKYV